MSEQLRQVWHRYADVFSCCEGERILWYLIDRTFENCSYKFRGFIDGIPHGQGFSPFEEGMGVWLYEDCDEERDYSWVVAYQGEDEFKLSVERFAEIILAAVDVYLEVNPKMQPLISASVNRISKWVSEVVNG